MWIEQVRADIALVSGLLGPDKSLHPWCSTLAWIRYGILHDYKLSIKKVKNDVSAFILAWLTLLQDNHKKSIFYSPLLAPRMSSRMATVPKQLLNDVIAALETCRKSFSVVLCSGNPAVPPRFLWQHGLHWVAFGRDRTKEQFTPFFKIIWGDSAKRFYTVARLTSEAAVLQ